MLGKFALFFWVAFGWLWWATTEPTERAGMLFSMGAALLIAVAAAVVVRWLWRLFAPPRC